MGIALHLSFANCLPFPPSHSSELGLALEVLILNPSSRQPSEEATDSNFQAHICYKIAL